MNRERLFLLLAVIAVVLGGCTLAPEIHPARGAGPGRLAQRPGLPGAHGRPPAAPVAAGPALAGILHR